ncbi:hypothetical protein PBY51_019643 [Eleginops maclovinus]|uniref:Secreted protein n=1 Tax=Eleginops maclovinus TaxID=56733 RepID=A0AAN8AQZ0_ELEMC|nr:hypothetical protein PBY51_019643 [Eleginops maclovinus]
MFLPSLLLPVCQVLCCSAGSQPAGSGTSRPAPRLSGGPDPLTCGAEAAGNQCAVRGGLDGRSRSRSSTGGEGNSMFTSTTSRPE